MASLIGSSSSQRRNTAGLAFPPREPVKTVSSDVPRPRVLLFGIRCGFTNIVAARLALSEYPPVALILPGPPTIETPILIPTRNRQLPMAMKDHADATPDLPTYQIGNLDALATVTLVEDIAPDLIVVACFPRLIPRVVYQRAHLGAVNIHPSLLPAHRGPDPLFWIMRDGGIGCGVTVHALADRFDRGDILAQQSIPYPDGARESELESILAQAGADLTRSVLDAITTGTQNRMQQDEPHATYESWPTGRDYVLDTNRPALHAWNFVRGVAERGVPVRVATVGGDVFISDAAEFGDAGDPPSAGDGQVVIRFNPGWLLAKVDRGTIR